MKYLTDEVAPEPPDTPAQIVARWTRRFVMLGAAGGVLLMLGRTPPIAESGGKPDNVFWYWFWIPITTVLGLIGGIGFGILVAIWSKLRDMLAAAR